MPIKYCQSSFCRIFIRARRQTPVMLADEIHAMQLIENLTLRDHRALLQAFPVTWLRVRATWLRVRDKSARELLLVRNASIAWLNCQQ